MNPIAVYIGSVVLYWSAVIISVGFLAALFMSISVQLSNKGRLVSMLLFFPLAIVFSIPLCRALHWYCHQEQYDGKGYPEHLNGEKIPMYGRMIAVGDVVDAMNSKRTYKDSIDMSAVIAELKRCAGTQLDPQYAADMVKILEGGFVADTDRDVDFDEEEE